MSEKAGRVGRRRRGSRGRRRRRSGRGRRRRRRGYKDRTAGGLFITPLALRYY